MTLDNKSFLFSNPEEQDFEKKYIEMTKIKYTERVTVGDSTLETWYYSPYPGEYANVEHLYVCPRCLKYMRKQKTLRNPLSNDNCKVVGDKVYDYDGL